MALSNSVQAKASAEKAKLRTILFSSGHQENWDRVEVHYASGNMYLESKVGDYPQYGLAILSIDQALELIDVLVEWINSNSPAKINSQILEDERRIVKDELLAELKAEIEKMKISVDISMADKIWNRALDRVIEILEGRINF